MGFRDNDVKGAGSDVRVHGTEPGVSPDPTQESLSRKDLESRLEELRAIARSVGLDADLKVTLGEPGQGSYCQYGGPASLRVDRVNRSIVIDPLHLLDEGNAFIIAHEGMHAYVTRSAFDRAVHVALKGACDPEALYDEIGFGSLLNYLEDCGGNDWLTKAYPSFEELEQKLYDPMLREENPEMHTGETKAVMARLGFFPRFAQFGSEVMKRWHTGSYSTTLDPSVGDALRKKQQDVDAFISSFPASQVSPAAERDALFCKRFLIAAVKIMPTLRELVKKDKVQAGMQQFLNQQSQRNQQNSQSQSGQPQSAGQQGGANQQEGGQNSQPNSGQHQRGQSQPGQPQGSGKQEGEGQQGSAGQQGSPSPNQSARGRRDPQNDSSQRSDGTPSSASSGAGIGSQLSPQAAREVNEKTASHRAKLREQLQQGLDKLEKHLGGQGASGGGALPEPASKDPSKQIEDLRKAIEEKFDGATDQAAKQEVERHLDQLEKLGKSLDSQAAPIGELSQKTQDQLKDLYDHLPKAERDLLEQAGEELLKELEDAIRDQLEGKSQEDPAPTHKQNSEAKDQAAQAAKAYQQMREDAAQLEEIRRSKLSLWDAALEDVSGSIAKLYSRLERILRPAVPEYESGHATGSRPHLPTVMQAKADRKLVSKMWDQKSLPIEREFAFSLLVDNSGSMQTDEKYHHARQCAVLLSEVLTRLKVPFEISIFSDGSRVVKNFDEKPSKGRKNEIGGAIDGCGGGTQDYAAVKKCVEAIGSRSEEHKFLIVITDGGSSNGTELQKEIRKALDRGVRVIGLGLGAGTTDVDQYYPIGRGELSIDPTDKEAALGPYFSKLLEGILKNPEQFIARALREKATATKSGS